MSSFSLVSEYLALLFLAVIMHYFHDRRQTWTFRRKLYFLCLSIAMASIVLNVATVYMDRADVYIPLFINVLVNTLYFLASGAMSLLVGLYLVNRIYEYADSSTGYKIACGVLWALTAAYGLFLVMNVFNGCLFYFDDASNYYRGPLNRIVYVLPVLEVILISVCYARRKRSVSHAVSRVLKGVPAACAVLLVLQLIFPDYLLNGTFAAIINLIIFVNFQSVRVEEDALTELPNRNSFASELELRLNSGENYEVVLVALRGFSQVNEVYGHECGDAVLRQVARELESHVKGGFVFRFGGDQFVMLLPDASPATCNERLLRLSSSLRHRHVVGEHSIRTNQCIVELRYAGRDWSSEEIVNRLEFGLAIAKHENMELLRFDSQVALRYLRREEIMASMRTALDEDRFEVWYQPIYEASTGRFSSAEALIRLRDEKGRLIGPDEFIPLAENSEIIDDLTWFVIEEVCELLASEAVPELEGVSVNLTARQVLQHGIEDKLQSIAASHGIKPSQLRLEITERTAVESGEYLSRKMQKLRARGFEFMLDDFGTGYSNLSSVLYMPFSYVKLDRSLMNTLETDPNSRLMAQTLVPFFHKLGMHVVAEGIENEEQVKLILGYGVNRIQGYYFARPMDTTKLIDWYELNSPLSAPPRI